MNSARVKLRLLAVHGLTWVDLEHEQNFVQREVEDRGGLIFFCQICMQSLVYLYISEDPAAFLSVSERERERPRDGGAGKLRAFFVGDILLTFSRFFFFFLFLFMKFLFFSENYFFCAADQLFCKLNSFRLQSQLSQLEIVKDMY